MTTGYLPPAEDKKLYQLGASPLPQEILEPDGDWTKFSPKFEPQRKRFETFNCCSFNTIDCIQRLLQRLGDNTNWSDRFTGITAGTSAQGNSPTIVAEAIRKNGLIPEDMMPFSDDLENIDDYYSWDIEKGACITEGKNWLNNWEFGYEQVPCNPESMMTALRYSPLGCAVYAWEEQNGLYVSDMPANHWSCVVTSYEKNKYWLVDDSYLQDGTNLKKLAWDFKFDFVLRYHIDKKKEKEQLTIMQNILSLIQKIISIIMNEPKPMPTPEIKPEPIAEPVVAPVTPPKYDWSNREACRHSLRVIADEEKLPVYLKNQLCETVRFESGFNPKAININKDKSKDCGLCQLSEKFYLKYNNMTCQQAIDDPERCVRIMARAFKAGRARDWVAWQKLYLKSMNRKYGFASSSVNNQNLSLTIKGLIPLIVAIAGLFKFQVTGTDLETLVDILVMVISGIITSWGIIRKFKVKTDNTIDAY